MFRVSFSLVVAVKFGFLCDLQCSSLLLMEKKYFFCKVLGFAMF